MNVDGRKLVLCLGPVKSVAISARVKVMTRYSLSHSTFSSTSFEEESKSTRIESVAFCESSLAAIEILRNVELLGGGSFSNCTLLSVISFESGSALDAFSYSSSTSITTPRLPQFSVKSCFRGQFSFEATRIMFIHGLFCIEDDHHSSTC
jgi:hypothetical protein